MAKLHEKLARKYRWYREWHDKGNHGFYHWTIFSVSIIVAAFLIYSFFAYVPVEIRKLQANLASRELFEKSKLVGFAKNHILVAFSENIGRGGQAELLARNNLKEKSEITGAGVKIISIDEGDNPFEVAKKLREKEAGKIDFAEVDSLLPPSLTPNDPDFPNQWHLPKINSPSAWDTTSGNGVVIAIADTGIDPTHPDLASSLVPGWNVFDNTGDTSDVYGHGTAVAGTAAAVGDNGTGVAGVAYKASLMPIRVSDPGGNAYISNLASAITHAANNGAKIVNISYQAGGSQTIERAARYLFNKGGLTVVAAGNTGAESGYRNSQYIVSAAATDNSDTITPWSTYGKDVDVSAPGLAIWSTARGGGIGAWSGTSFSAPITSGVLALIFSANPSLTPGQAQNILFDSATDLGLPGWDELYGWGRIDATKAVELAKNYTAMIKGNRK